MRVYAVTVLLTSSEWIRIRDAASQRPKECLIRGKVVRRYTLTGIAALKDISPCDQARLVHQFRCSVESGDARLRQ
jgi:hypothetical protein